MNKPDASLLRMEAKMKKYYQKACPTTKCPPPIALAAIATPAVALAAPEEYEQVEEIAFDDFKGENEIDDT